jgi:SAM-dependent methyltransferase
MKTKQTAENYDKIASHWASDAFNKKNGIAAHERALKFARSKGVAIDIGCGSSGRIIDLLLSHGFEAEGFDFSSEMLALAKKKHPNVTFHHADICEWEFPIKYDFISAWDSIWHVPLDLQTGVLEKICEGLAPGGVFIFTTGGIDKPGDGANPFLGQPLYHAALGITETLRLMESCHCICRHLEYDQPPPEKHLYLIVQKASEGV